MLSEPLHHGVAAAIGRLGTRMVMGPFAVTVIVANCIDQEVSLRCCERLSCGSSILSHSELRTTKPGWRIWTATLRSGPIASPSAKGLRYELSNVRVVIIVIERACTHIGWSGR